MTLNKVKVAMKSFAITVVLAAASLASTAARADPRLDEKVYSPYIERGVAELEVRTAGQNGGQTGGDVTTVIETEYGVNDWLSLSLVGAVEQGRGEHPRFTGVGLEGVAYTGQIPKLGVDTGLYLEYQHGLNGEADTLEGKLLFAKTAGRFQGLANLIIERPLGPHDEAFGAYGYAVSATWRTVGPLRLGAEAFGDIGDDHRFPAAAGAYIGPQVLWEGRPWHAPFEIALDAGWLFPVGDFRAEASSQFRIGIELERRF